MKKIPLVVMTLVLVAGASSCGSDSSSDTTLPAESTTTVATQNTDPATTGFELKIGENSGPNTIAEFTQGDNVVLTVVNNSADDEVHVHGYDLTTGELPKGQTATLAFTADQTGDFEVESHLTEEVLMIIRVAAK